ncbi:MAG TPA: hypothetical protein DCO75_04035, partial [Fibrobacteres bacterium]|nr:hypothetical protein [Fibrobacterota bacterium]
VITWSFQNGGYFVRGGSGAAATAPAVNSVPMTAIAIAEKGTASWGATAPTLPSVTVGTQGTAVDVSMTQSAQTTPTINEQIVINGTWAKAAANAMAGLYTETITFSIAATL